MKSKAFAVVAVALALARPAARGGTPFDAVSGIAVTSISVSIGPTGVTTYRLAGFVDPAVGPRLEFTGQCAYDPQQRRAQERLVETSTGNVINTKADCATDPWRGERRCTGGQVESPGFSPAVSAVINNIQAPVSANLMTYEQHQAIDAAYNGQVAANAAAAEAAAKAAADRATATKAAAATATAIRRATLSVPVVPIANPQGYDAKVFAIITPTPDPHTIKARPLPGATGGGAFVFGTATPTPRPQYPPYGASYSSNAVLASLSVNQTTFLPVTVKNTSSQIWPKGGLFRLAYHWYRGTTQIVHDGARTLMPAAVAPGGSVTLSAKVVAPSSTGLSSLRWDMVHESVAWFSDKGVAMSTPQTVSVSP